MLTRPKTTLFRRVFLAVLLSFGLTVGALGVSSTNSTSQVSVSVGLPGSHVIVNGDPIEPPPPILK